MEGYSVRELPAFIVHGPPFVRFCAPNCDLLLFDHRPVDPNDCLSGIARFVEYVADPPGPLDLFQRGSKGSVRRSDLRWVDQHFSSNPQANPCWHSVSIVDSSPIVLQTPSSGTAPAMRAATRIWEKTGSSCEREGSTWQRSSLARSLVPATIAVRPLAPAATAISVRFAIARHVSIIARSGVSGRAVRGKPAAAPSLGANLFLEALMDFEIERPYTRHQGDLSP